MASPEPQHSRVALSDEDLLRSEGQAFPDAENDRLNLKLLHGHEWMDCILPKKQLEILMDAALDLARKGQDTTNKPCQMFYQEGLMSIFVKMFTEEVVNDWETLLHTCVFRHAMKLVELCVLKLKQDCMPLQEILTTIFNPQCNFHVHNATRHSETVPMYSQLTDEELFARPPANGRTPKDRFPPLFYQALSQRDNLPKTPFTPRHQSHYTDTETIWISKPRSGRSIDLDIWSGLAGRSCESLWRIARLSDHTGPFCSWWTTIRRNHTATDQKISRDFLDALSDEVPKKAAFSEWKMESMIRLPEDLSQLVTRVPGQEETVKSLQSSHLKLILRGLSRTSFNGKLNSLDNLNRDIKNASSPQTEGVWLTDANLTKWMQKNNVLSILMSYEFAYPQFVEKLLITFRFMIKHGVVEQERLGIVLREKMGNNKANEGNVEELLSNLASDQGEDAPEELSQLLTRFQETWASSGKDSRDELLEKIGLMAEYDKKGPMANKVLESLWNMAIRQSIRIEMRDEVLTVHRKIINFSCCQDRLGLKLQWLKKFVDELKTDEHSLTSMTQFTAICRLFEEKPKKVLMTSAKLTYREDVLGKIQMQGLIVKDVVDNLLRYMRKAGGSTKRRQNADPHNIFPDDSFPHDQQVRERLQFLRFLFKECKELLYEPEANKIWKCLAENAIFKADRGSCFNLFTEIIDEGYIDPGSIKGFFRNSILQLDHRLWTKNGTNCFKKYSDQVEVSTDDKMEKLREKHQKVWDEYNSAPSETTEQKADKKSCNIS